MPFEVQKNKLFTMRAVLWPEILRLVHECVVGITAEEMLKFCQVAMPLTSTILFSAVKGNFAMVASPLLFSVSVLYCQKISYQYPACVTLVDGICMKKFSFLMNRGIDESRIRRNNATVRVTMRLRSLWQRVVSYCVTLLRPRSTFYVTVSS